MECDWSHQLRLIGRRLLNSLRLTEFESNVGVNGGGRFALFAVDERQTRSAASSEATRSVGRQRIPWPTVTRGPWSAIVDVRQPIPVWASSTPEYSPRIAGPLPIDRVAGGARLCWSVAVGTPLHAALAARQLLGSVVFEHRSCLSWQPKSLIFANPTSVVGEHDQESADRPGTAQQSDLSTRGGGHRQCEAFGHRSAASVDACGRIATRFSCMSFIEPVPPPFDWYNAIAGEYNANSESRKMRHVAFTGGARRWRRETGVPIDWRYSPQKTRKAEKTSVAIVEKWHKLRRGHERAVDVSGWPQKHLMTYPGSDDIYLHMDPRSAFAMRHESSPAPGVHHMLLVIAAKLSFGSHNCMAMIPRSIGSITDEPGLLRCVGRTTSECGFLYKTYSQHGRVASFPSTVESDDYNSMHFQPQRSYELTISENFFRDRILPMMIVIGRRDDHPGWSEVYRRPEDGDHEYSSLLVNKSSKRTRMSGKASKKGGGKGNKKAGNGGNKGKDKGKKTKASITADQSGNFKLDNLYDAVDKKSKPKKKN